MIGWVGPRGRQMVVGGVMATLVLVLGTGKAWAPANEPPPGPPVLRLTLGPALQSFVTGFELNEEPTQHTLRVTLGFTANSILAAVRINQLFDAALLELFDPTLTKLATYRLSLPRVTALRIATDPTSGQVLQEMVLTYRLLAVTFP
jgi:hypothetical protein